MDAKPQRQTVGAAELNFAAVTFKPGASELEWVVRYAQTVRNNLFHGGKHGSTCWDEPKRMETPLSTTMDVLSELAEMAGLESDYQRRY